MFKGNAQHSRMIDTLGPPIANFGLGSRKFSSRLLEDIAIHACMAVAHRINMRFLLVAVSEDQSDSAMSGTS